MRIVSWNCNGALRNKLSQLDALNADVLIIQECEDPANSTSHYREWAGNFLWKGSSQHKGIGVFPKKGHTVCGLEWQGNFSLPGLGGTSAATSWTTDALELFLRFKLNGDHTILSVWTKGDDSRVFSYIGQLWKYLCIHLEDLSNLRSMVLGDFNSNAIWDKSDRWWNHSDVVTQLATAGLKRPVSHPERLTARKRNQPYTFPTTKSRQALSRGLRFCVLRPITLMSP